MEWNGMELEWAVESRIEDGFLSTLTLTLTLVANSYYMFYFISYSYFVIFNMFTGFTQLFLPWSEIPG